jgi:hypothetical protein
MEDDEFRSYMDNWNHTMLQRADSVASHTAGEYLVACLQCDPSGSTAHVFPDRRSRAAWSVQHKNENRHLLLRAAQRMGEHAGREQDCLICHTACDCCWPTHALGGRGCTFTQIAADYRRLPGERL